MEHLYPCKPVSKPHGTFVSRLNFLRFACNFLITRHQHQATPSSLASAGPTASKRPNPMDGPNPSLPSPVSYSDPSSFRVLVDFLAPSVAQPSLRHSSCNHYSFGLPQPSLRPASFKELWTSSPTTSTGLKNLPSLY